MCWGTAYFALEMDGMTNKQWTHSFCKHHRLKRRAADPRPTRFRLRAPLAEVGWIARILRRHGLAVTVPTRIGSGD